MKVRNLALTSLVLLASNSYALTYQGAHVSNREILVKLNNVGMNSVQKSLSGLKIKERMNLSFGEFAVLEVAEGESYEETLKRISQLGEVEYAEPNYEVKAIGFEPNVEDILANANLNSKNYSMNTPTDPEFGKLWGLVNTGDNEPVKAGQTRTPGKVGADISAVQAWGLSRGSRNVTVAVIDTGIDYNHPDLANQMWVNDKEANGEAGVDDDGNGFIDDVYGYDFANNDGDPLDGHSHGTHCAGTIGAEHDNGIGVAGVMKDVSIMAIKFLTDSGSGSTANAIKAVDYATKMNVDIMSNSWGGGGASQALEDAIKRAKDAGILFVAAAGNSSTNNDSKPHYPSNYNVENVISVAAHNAQDSLATFSCYGKKTVHVAAPGRNILSTVKGGEYAVYSGTSMATPHVSGILGLYVSTFGRTDFTELKNKMMSTSVYDPAYKNKLISEGRINVYNMFVNHQPARPAKPSNDWIDEATRETLETPHPYLPAQVLEFEISKPGAKFLRVVFEKIETEAKYDTIEILDKDGNLVETISGTATDKISEYVDGDYLKIRFKADRSKEFYGFKVKGYQFQ